MWQTNTRLNFDCLLLWRTSDHLITIALVSHCHLTATNNDTPEVTKNGHIHKGCIQTNEIYELFTISIECVEFLGRQMNRAWRKWIVHVKNELHFPANELWEFATFQNSVNRGPLKSTQLSRKVPYTRLPEEFRVRPLYLARLPGPNPAAWPILNWKIW